jgi:uncharacterized RDD family membrane protein YckC
MSKEPTNEQLFDLASAELQKTLSTLSLELDITQLQSISQQQHEHAAILFDLALEELIDPTAATKYLSLDEAKISAPTESGQLSQALKRFETLVESSFKSPNQKPTSQRASSYRKPTIRVAIRTVPATLINRFSAVLLDVPYIVLLSLCLFVIVLPISSLGLFASIEKLSSGTTLEKIPVYALYLKLLLLAVVVQGIAALPKKGVTFGLKSAGLKVVSSNGALPTNSQLLIRSITSPLMIITAPFSLLWGAKRTLADILTSTIVAQR